MLKLLFVYILVFALGLGCASDIQSVLNTYNTPEEIIAHLSADNKCVQGQPSVKHLAFCYWTPEEQKVCPQGYRLLKDETTESKNTAGYETENEAGTCLGDFLDYKVDRLLITCEKATWRLACNATCQSYDRDQKTCVGDVSNHCPDVCANR